MGEEETEMSNLDDFGSSDDEDDEEDDIDVDGFLMCPICMEDFGEQKVAIPEDCMHMFCAECLQEWMKNVNTCPVDRKKFNSISILLNKDGTVLEEIYVEDKDMKLPEEEFHEPPTYCEVCGECDREESLLLCDECDKGYHLDCLSPPLLSVPIEEWYCTECLPLIEERERLRMQRRYSRSRNSNSEAKAFVKDQEEDNKYIGDEDDLINLFERTHNHNIQVHAQSLVFGLPVRRRTRARTAATSQMEQRGRRRSGRGSLRTVRRGRSSSRGSSSRSSKKRKKSSLKRKTSPTKKSNATIQKEKRKLIKEQLRKFREKLSQHTDTACSDDSLAIYGRYLDLDEFYGDPQETFELEKNPSPPRSTIVNTTDVVGSILGGFGTLNPDNVTVQRDGSLKEKQHVENEGSVCRLLSESTVSIMNENKKRRKIRFATDSSDDELKQIDNAQKTNFMDCKNDQSSFSINNSTVSVLPIKNEASESLAAAMQARYFASLKQNEGKKKFEERCKAFRKESKIELRNRDNQTLNLSNFKIPKKKQPVKENSPTVAKTITTVPSLTFKTSSASMTSNNHQYFTYAASRISSNGVTTRTNHNESGIKVSKIPKKQKYDARLNSSTVVNCNQLEKFSRESLQTIKTDYAGEHKNSVQHSVDQLSIQANYASLDGKRKANTDNKSTAIMEQNDKTRNEIIINVNNTSPNGNLIKHNFISPKYLLLKKKGTKGFTVKKRNISSRQTQTDIKENAKKAISFDDYKKRQLFEEIFGEADLEDSLESANKKISKKNVWFAKDGAKHLISSKSRVESRKSLLDISTQKIDINNSQRKYEVFDEVKQILLSSCGESLGKSVVDARQKFSKIDRSESPQGESEKLNKKLFSCKSDRDKGDDLEHKHVTLNLQSTQTRLSKKSSKCKRELPIAVVAPLPFRDYVENTPIETITRKTTDRLSSDHSLKHNEGLSKSLPKVLGSSIGGQRQNQLTKDQLKTKEEMLQKIKSLLKPFYSTNKLTKEQWKNIVKRALKKVSVYPAYYRRDGKLEKLVNNYLEQYLKS